MIIPFGVTLILTFCTIGFMRIGITRFEVTGGFSEIARSPIVLSKFSRKSEKNDLD